MLKYILFKASSKILILTFIFFLVYNTIFGWNKTPLSDAEIICDDILILSCYIAVWCYMFPLMVFIATQYDKKMKDKYKDLSIGKLWRVKEKEVIQKKDPFSNGKASRTVFPAEKVQKKKCWKCSNYISCTNYISNEHVLCPICLSNQ
jgi:hypothetical protein